MRVIFLDVDGVLNYAHFKLPHQEFVPECFKCLKRLVDETDAKVVISSSWKEHPMMLAKINQELRKYGIPSIGATPKMIKREDEIKQWLSMHSNIEQFVILDDWDMRDTFPNNAVATVESMRVGLDDAWTDEAKKILLTK